MLIRIYIPKNVLRSAIILKNKPNVSDERSAIEYYDSMHNYTDDLRILQKDLRRKIK